MALLVFLFIILIIIAVLIAIELLKLLACGLLFLCFLALIGA
jgi:hypothetical protein